MSVMQPLRDEHQELWREVERLRALAEQVGERGPGEFDRELAAAHRFLLDRLIPHARAEEEVLYPAVAAAMGSPAATATMSRDHVEVERLAEELGRLRERPDSDPAALQRLLYGAYALLAVHFAKEDEIYLPMLEQVLSAEEAERLLGDLSRAAHATPVRPTPPAPPAPPAPPTPEEGAPDQA